MDKNTNSKIGVTEAAKLLGVDTRTIHRRIERGELFAEKLNEGLRAAYLLNRAEVEAKANQNG